MTRIWVGIVACVAVVAVAPWVGPTPGAEVAEFVIWQLRMPRVAIGAAVGATLGVVGATFQALFGNPLATPSTTGTTAGAALGALVALVLLPTAPRVVLVGLAFIGALAVAVPVAALAARRAARLEDVLLAGVALTLAAGAITTGLQVNADDASTRRAVLWSLGSLAQVGYDGLAWLMPFCAVAIVGSVSQVRSLDALAAGEARAFSQGVDVARVRVWLLGVGALGVAACVAWCGPIAFVGLVVPHLVRLSVGATRRRLVPLSGVVGAAFLVACDTVARSAIPGRDLPVGVLTAAIGAPMLVALVLRRR